CTTSWRVRPCSRPCPLTSVVPAGPSAWCSPSDSSPQPRYSAATGSVTPMRDKTSSSPRPAGTPPPGRYAYEGLDRVLHEKARLGIMTSLATRPSGLSFNELKQPCASTDGNLNRHLDV